MRESLANWLIVAMAGLLTIGAVGGLQWPVDAAVAIAIGVTILNWHRLARVARIFVLGACVSILGFIILAPEQIGELRIALAQGTKFAALLAMLGVLRHPVRRSDIIARAAAWLLAFPRATRYAAINIGSHFLSLLFNVGIIAMIGDLTRNDRPAADDIDAAERQSLIMAGMRGLVLMTIWSPMGIGFAIVVTSVSGLNAVHFLGLAFATAIVMLLVTCFVEAPRDRAASVPDPSPDVRGSPMPLIAVLSACTGLLIVTILLHEGLAISFVSATVLVLPVFAILWLLLERKAPRIPLSSDLRRMVAGIGDMRTESAIFLSATVIGAGISLVVREQGFWQIMQNGDVPVIAVLLFCLIVVPLAGALYIPHSILVVIIAQLFGSGPIGAEHPMALALSLMLGWSMAIAISPISATTLLTGNLCKVPPSIVGLNWNRSFVLTLAAISSVAVLAVYLAES
ncbi:hypothetical protein [Pseudogemmobacter sonorensis]|uniref:hypothetical protein n=1 Tax=Pseudogemmobacter sonorensis TaxID=2989681 RepID=UPI0036B5C673